MTPHDVPQLTEADRDLDASEPTSLGVLSCSQGLLPLVGLTIDTIITGLVATTTVTERFVNNLDQPLEATYILPLPDHAAVTSFVARIGDRVVRGLLQERAEARADYDEAVATGHRAAIAEEDRPECFSVRIANLGPAETAELELTLTGAVAFDLGEATFRFPLVVAPRYIPGIPLEGAGVGEGTALDTDLVPDASRITPPVLLDGHPHPVAFAATVRIDPTGGQVSDLRSALPATFSPADEEGTVVMSVQPGQRLDRDLILRWRLDVGDASTPLAVIVPDEEGPEATLSVTFTPPTDARDTDRPARDIVVVLDRSGSMGGWKMVAARRAAARIVDSLTARDRFAVLAFDNTIERPPRLTRSGVVAATDRNRFAAVEFLSRLEARGGTEMAAPLTCALDELGSDPAGDRRRYVVVVTDGQIGNEDHLLREVAARLGDTTIFAIGIDQAVNAGFLRRLATVGGGRLELVESEDRLDHAFATIQQRLGRPTLRDLRVEVDDAELVESTMTPGSRRECYSGAPLVLNARLQRLGDRPTITIRATRADDSTEQWTIPAQRRDAPAITACWARARIRDLEDAFASGNPEITGDEIVGVSLRFGVLSRFTAFVAVDDAVTDESTELIRVVQPVELPNGWQTTAASTAMGVARLRFGADQGDAMGITLGGAERASTRTRRRIRQIRPAALESLRSAEPTSEPPAGATSSRFAGRLNDVTDGTMELISAPPGEHDAGSLRREVTDLADDLISVGGQVRLIRLLRELAECLAGVEVDPGDPDALEALRIAVQAVLEVAGADLSSAAFWSRRPS